MADLSPQIESAAGAPASTSVDGTETVSHSLESLIEADRYLAAKAAASTKNRGLRFSKILPAGAACDSQGSLQGGSFDQPGLV